MRIALKICLNKSYEYLSQNAEHIRIHTYIYKLSCLYRRDSAAILGDFGYNVLLDIKYLENLPAPRT